MSLKLKVKKPLPFDFVFGELEGLPIETKPMFGCYAIYLDDKMLMILRDREDYSDDNGVWIATYVEHHDSLRQDFPNMRSISFLSTKGKPTTWQNIAKDSDDFESKVLLACEMIRNGDHRIGKVPKSRSKNSSGRTSSNQKKTKKPARVTRRRPALKSSRKSAPARSRGKRS